MSHSSHRLGGPRPKERNGLIRTRLFAVTGLAAAAVMGAGVSLAATHAATSSTSNTINGCYNTKTGEMYYLPAGHTCSSGTKGIHWNVTGPKGATGPAGPKGATGAAGTDGKNGTNGTNGVSPTVTALAAGNANCPGGGDAITDASGKTTYVCNGTSYEPVTATASIAVTNDPDSGYNSEPEELSTGGIWALDDWTLNITITRHAAANLSKCVNAPTGNATCYYYTGTAGISGTFQTLAGAYSPGIKDTPINGIVQGTMTASYDFEFYADSGSLSSTNVPAAINNLNNQAFAGTSDAKLYAGFFPAGTDIQNSSTSSPSATVNQPDWVFNYLATSENCTSPLVQETWSDSYDVTEADGGDITGNCVAATS